MKFLKKHKRSGGVIVSLLLLLCLIPMGCGGSSDAEPVSPPKTSYELEDMIKEVKDSGKVRDQDILDLKADIKSIETTNYDDEIADILTKLAELEAMLVTPTPNPNGSQPTPVPTASIPSNKLTAKLYPDATFLGERGNYSFQVTINNNTGKTVNPDVTITIGTGVATSILWLNYSAEFDIDFYQSQLNCEAIYFTQEDIGNIPSGGSRSFMLHMINFSTSQDVYWTPSISVE